MLYTLLWAGHLSPARLAILTTSRPFTAERSLSGSKENRNSLLEFSPSFQKLPLGWYSIDRGASLRFLDNMTRWGVLFGLIRNGLRFGVLNLTL